ncbi:MAG TPA: isoleucine--tRNA ligase [Acidimicrobiales bacterium]|nr:isoleucine--tRNA ligase [Acidimicrobiales bacterium]
MASPESAGADLPYPDVEPQPNLPKLEEAILSFWADDGTFQASIDQRPAGPDGSNEFVFYDGPPFANGLPHFGSLLTGYVKDVVPRFRTMQGRRVERRFGWDCHGLPPEMQAEKELGLDTKADIVEYGVDKFNAYCQSSVLRYTQEWEQYVTRQARWVDFRNDYKTMDLDYMESVLWALKELWAKDLLYEGFNVLAYCGVCETPLSNFETRQDDAYRERQDPAVTVTFTLDPVMSGSAGTVEKILVWTTTPWTLPSNLALAVGPDIDYAAFEEDGTRYIIGEATADKYEAQLANATRVGTMKGSELVGRRYTPLFPFFADAPNAFVVLSGDFVTTEDGTGTVHMAPGFGEDDQRVCEAAGITTVVPVDQRARFTSEVPPYAGLGVFDANAPIIRDLKDAGVLVRHDTYVHAYPHCWRTDNPLIYKAVSSWFVRVTALRDRLLANNQLIDWTPEHIKDGAFGKWLEGARDWPISRNRFWGSPIPVWKSDDPAYPRIDVYGSLDELERDFGVRPTDLHRPAIDELTRPNPDDPTGKSTMRRVEDVLDCWFDSGSMPFAQVHYPFENQEWFEHHYPGDFIVEYISQTRGWFYTLHVLATALFDRPAFSSCMVHGVVLDDEGQKLSKRSKNYTDPLDAFDRIGSDAVRWFLVSSPILRGADQVVTEKGIVEVIRRVINPLWSSWHFFALYANAERRRATPRTDSAHTLDRYILAKTSELVAVVTARLDAYDLYGACEAFERYVDGALNNWYIRRSRPRFWRGDPDAFDTLATVLETVLRVAAPLLPMVAEAAYKDLTGARSVHLTDWPSPDALLADADLVTAMDRVRDVCSAAHSLRKASKRRARLPLPSLTVAAADAERLAPFRDLIADELNVKEVHLTGDVEEFASFVLQPLPGTFGARLGDATQQVIRAAKNGDWTADGDRVTVAGHVLEPGEFELRLRAASEDTTRALPGNDGVVVLDTATTPELEAEGIARDVVRLVQDVRREVGLDVSDRIRLVLHAAGDVRAAVETHGDYVEEQTLAVELLFADDKMSDAHRRELPDGRAVHIGVTRVTG